MKKYAYQVTITADGINIPHSSSYVVSAVTPGQAAVIAINHVQKQTDMRRDHPRVSYVNELSGDFIR